MAAAAPHGGGAFSGKDPTKVDRSAAYAARYLAKNVVAAGLADRCTIQVAYAIGVAKPLSFYVDTGGAVDEAKLGRVLQRADGSVAARHPHPSRPEPADLYADLVLWPFRPRARGRSAAFPGSGSISPTSCAARSDGSRWSKRRAAAPGWFYGRRRGRPLRAGQQALVDGLLPHLSFDLPAAGELDPRRTVCRAAATIWLEIGFGGGEHLAAQAERHPEIGFIGCEVFENGIARLLGEIERRVSAMSASSLDDARLLIAALPPASIGRVFILFPDPWPKQRHHKRRIVSRETLDRSAEIMTDGAELRLATDDPGYLSWMLEQRDRPPGLRVARPPPGRLARAPAGLAADAL